MATRPRRHAPNGIFAADVRVFRFYPDGTVLDVLIKPAPRPSEGAQIASWLRRGNRLQGVHETSYRLSGRRISFQAKDHIYGGDVEVTGTYRNDELILNLQSRTRTSRAVNFQRIWPTPTPTP